MALITHVFSQIYLHFNWHVQHDEKVLHGPLELYVQNFIRNRCRQTRGVFFEDIGGNDTHAHLAVRCEPFITPADFIGEIKGSSSCEANKHFKRKILDWRRSCVVQQTSVALGSRVHSKSAPASRQGHHQCSIGAVWRVRGATAESRLEAG